MSLGNGRLVTTYRFKMSSRSMKMIDELYSLFSCCYGNRGLYWSIAAWIALRKI